MNRSADSIRVLHVEDDLDFAELAAEFIERHDEQLTVETASNSREGLDRLDGNEFDCVVSDFDLPGEDGIAFLEAVRERYSDLPFILYTGKGSEEVASDAIYAGVTDYLQKESGTSQYEVLANRIRNAVEGTRASAAIRRTEDWASTLLEHSSDYVFVVDGNGLITYVSPSVERVMGYAPAEITGSSAFEFTHPDDMEVAFETFAETLENPDEDVTVEFRAQHADGSTRWLEVRGRNLLDNPVVAGVLVNARDITERKHRERELERERERFAALYDNFPEPTITYEFVDDEPVIRAVNDAFVEVFGYDVDTAVGTPVDDLIVPPEKLDEAQAIDERVRAGELVNTELRRRTTTGLRDFWFRNIPVPGDYAPDGFGVYADVTDRKVYERTLEALHEASDRLLRAETRTEAAETVVDIAATVLDEPYASVFLWDEETERLVAEAASDEALETFGEPPTFGAGEGLVGYAYRAGERLVLDDAQADPRALESGADQIRAYCVFPLDEHGVIVFGSPEVGAFEQRDIDLASNLAAHTGVALDRVAREQTLRRQTSQLQRQNERLDEFASIVSHDLRNPLSVAKGRLELALDEHDSEDLDAVAAAQDRMEELIENLLSLARFGAAVGETEPVELSELIEDCWGNVETETARLVLETDAAIRADEARLRQLVENVLRNAVEHGGPVVTITVGDLEDGFYVEDDGLGFPDADREQLLQPGYSTKPAGTGFGLSIVRDIAEAHGWDLDLSAGADGGARFEITGVERAD